MSWLGNRRRVELAIFLLALAVRLAWVGTIESTYRDLIGPDARSYDDLAIKLLEGKGLRKWDYQGLYNDPNRALIVTSFRPPLLPIVLAGVYGVAGHHFWVARVAMALLSAATCVVVSRVARRVFGAEVAAVAGALLAVYPKAVYYSGMVVTENLYLFLVAMLVALLLAAGEAERGAWRWPLAGAVMGLATLCRSALLGFPVFAALWVWVVRPRKRRAVGEVALLALGFVVAMGPWWVRNAALHGRFVPATTEGGLTFWVTNREGADGSGHVDYSSVRGKFEDLSEAEIDREFYRLGRAQVRAHPGAFVRLAAGKFVRFWRLWPHASEPSVGLAAAIMAGVSFTPVLLLAAWGALLSVRQWRPLLLIYLLIAYYTLLHMVYMAITRYRLPLEPFLIVLASHALVAVVKRRRSVPAEPVPGTVGPEAS